MTATERAKQINEETAARAGAEGWLGWGMLVTDDAYWEASGVSTGEQLDTLLAFEEFIDSYKDTYGIKPRWLSWSDKTVTEWIEGINDLRGVRDDLNEQIESDRERSQAEHEARDASVSEEEAAFDKMDLLQESLEGIRPERASQIG
jgi:hypothetical protein